MYPFFCCVSWLASILERCQEFQKEAARFAKQTVTKHVEFMSAHECTFCSKTFKTKQALVSHRKHLKDCTGPDPDISCEQPQVKEEPTEELPELEPPKNMFDLLEEQATQPGPCSGAETVGGVIDLEHDGRRGSAIHQCYSAMEKATFVNQYEQTKEAGVSYMQFREDCENLICLKIQLL